MAETDFRALPSLALSTILEKLSRGDQDACATVCRDWLLVARERWRRLRVVMRPPHSVVPDQALRGAGLCDMLRRFPQTADLRIAGLAVADEALPPLPPLPNLRALDLENFCLSSLSLSTWQRLRSLTSLSFTERNCDIFTGKEVLLELPLLEELSVTCLSGDVLGFLSRMPGLPALRRFSLNSFVCGPKEYSKSSSANSRVESTEESFPWMCNLERLQLRISEPGLACASDGIASSLLVEAILGSCTGIEHLALSMECCSVKDIVKAASLKSLRSLQVHAVCLDDFFRSPEESAALMQLRNRLTALCVSCRSYQADFGTARQWHLWDLMGLQSSLEALGISQQEGADFHIAAASLVLAPLDGLGHVQLGRAVLLPAEPLTALQGLTKLELQIWAVNTRYLNLESCQRQIQRIQLNHLPQLRLLVLDLNVGDRWEPSLEATLLEVISRSSADVDLGLDLRHTAVDSPVTFLRNAGDRLVALRICFRARQIHTGCFILSSTRKELAFSYFSYFSLPYLGRLRRLRVRFDCESDLETWVESLTQRPGELPQLRYICVLFCRCLDAWIDERLVLKAMCSAFPSVTEVCIHGNIQGRHLSLCSSCIANEMDKFEPMIRSDMY